MDLTASSTPWPGVIRPKADPGLATCLAERRICRRDYGLPISQLDVEALALAEWAVARPAPLVLCPADPLAPLAELIAAAVHVADMAAQYARTGSALGSARRVAVATSDYHARGFYRTLGVRNPRSGGVASLADVVAAGTLTPDGTVRVVGNSTGGWSTVFVSSVRDIAEVGDVDVAIVDLAVPDAVDALGLGIPVVLVARDPSHFLLRRFASDVLVFGWDAHDLARLREVDGLPPRLRRRAQGCTCEVVAVPSHAVCENAALFWDDVGPLIRSGGRSGIARELGREAFALFHDLVGLALPLDMFESATAPVRARVDAIAAASRLTRGETRDLYLPSVELELRHLAAALSPCPPKHDALRRTLERLLDESDDVLLVVRTAELRRIYETVLARDEHLAAVRVRSIAAVADEDPVRHAVLTGMAPTWARWLYRSGIAETLHVLAYAPEGPVEATERGFDEVNMVRRVIADQTAREMWIARPAAKDRVWSTLSGDPRLVTADGGLRPPDGDTDDVAVTAIAPIEVPPGLWEGDGWLADLEPDGGIGRQSSPERAGRALDEIVAAVRIHFEEGGSALMEAAGSVTRFGAGSGDVDLAYPVARLKPGDRVVFFDGDSRKDLLAKVLEVAVEVPGLAVAAGWVAHWRRVLLGAYRNFGSYAAFRSALADEGCTVQTQTVRLWVIGVTIGPDDDEDVRRVGVVTGDAVLTDRHLEICRAVQSLRGAHVKLGRRLSEMARRIGPAAATGHGSPDEVVVGASGLTAADFQDSVDMRTVRSAQPAGDVPYIVIGQLDDQEEHDDA